MNDEPVAPVETPRLRLRCVRESDAVATARLLTPTVSRWLASWPQPATADAAAARIAWLRDATVAGRALGLAIERLDAGDLIGWVMLLKVEGDTRLGDLGYWLGEPFQGQGFMTEAARAAVSDAFPRLALDVVQAGAQPENEASFRVMRRLGMTPIGRRTVWASGRGREEACDYYAVTRATFDATVRAAAPPVRA